MEDKNIQIDETVAEDSIVTLLGEDGIEHNFIEVAQIEYQEKLYLILQPLELLDDMAEDEALVFRVDPTDGENARFELELNEEVIDEVFKIYYQLLDVIDPEGGAN